MNEENNLTKLVNHCKEKGYDVEIILTSKEQLVFEERVKMNCFYCGKYNSSWKCPPRIPPINFDKMLDEFENIAFVHIKKEINDNFDIIRNESTIELHRALLECEKWLWDNNNSTSLSFIGGSCKLCKNGCAPNKCANPYQSRSPVEALGINVVKSVANIGIELVFPPKEYLTRIGMLLW